MRPATALEHLDITADDGVRLTADHYRTPMEGEVEGTVLIRTPYGRTQYANQAHAWCRAGYDVVVQDVRGRYGSAGTWNPYDKEGPDGAATAKYLAGNGLLNGPLILAGASYDAHCAVEAARVLKAAQVPEEIRRPEAAAPKPLAVVAMVPALGLYETAREPDGTPRLQDRIGWWHQHGFGKESGHPLPAAELRRIYRQAEERGMDWTIHNLIDDATYGPGSTAGWKRLWDASPADLHALYGQLNTPLLMISGQRDFFVAEAADLVRAWGSAAPRTLVETLWGPWGHRLGHDLGAGAAAALREQGGLMARIKDFLGAANDWDPPGARPEPLGNPRPPVLQWEPGDRPHTWRWAPAAPGTLPHHLNNHGES